MASADIEIVVLCLVGNRWVFAVRVGRRCDRLVLRQTNRYLVVLSGGQKVAMEDSSLFPACSPLRGKEEESQHWKSPVWNCLNQLAVSTVPRLNKVLPLVWFWLNAAAAAPLPIVL